MAILSNFRETLSNLFKKPATLDYPAKPRPLAARTRGHVAIDLPACIYCGICQKKCPTGAIKVAKADVTWSIARMSCIQCGACVECCPKKCLALENAATPPASTPTLDVFQGVKKEKVDA